MAGFPAQALAPIASGRYISLSRPDLAASIFEKLEGKVETILGESVARIEQSDPSVHVILESEWSAISTLWWGQTGFIPGRARAPALHT